MNEVNMHAETGQAESLIIEKYSSTVYRIALSCTGSRHDAEDIMQEVFLRYLKKLRTFSSPEHEKAWFLRVAVNCCKTFYASPWRKKTLPLDDFENLPDSGIQSESSSELPVYEAVMSLPPKQRLCVHLYYYEDFSIKEISKTTGMPESTVKSHLFRARTALERKLKGEFHVE
jgi:RNA polymerase sigma factor, sigma-70 family